MSREWWFFLAGMLMVALPIAAIVVIKKLQLFEPGPDREIVYKTVGKTPLALHAFAAQASGKGPRPAILLFHGGRWLYGHPRAFYPQCQYFAAQGYHCFSAQYRLGANNRVDVRELVADAADALRFLQTKAGALGIDAAKIYIGGGSAGGHLAAAVGTRVPAAADAPRPAGLILYNPMLDLAPGTPDHHLVRDYWESVSPQQHIGQGLPPTLILLGSADPEVPVATAQAFCSAATAVGSTCELAIYEGRSHGFFNHEPDRTTTNQKVQTFLSALPN